MGHNAGELDVIIGGDIMSLQEAPENGAIISDDILDTKITEALGPLGNRISVLEVPTEASPYLVGGIHTESQCVSAGGIL